MWLIPPTPPAPTPPTPTSGSTTTTRAPAPVAPVAPVVLDEPDAPVRLGVTPPDGAASVVATETPAAAPETTPAAAVSLPGPFSVSFAAGDPAITRIEVKCGDATASGAPPVSLAAAPKGTCRVAGFGGSAPALTIVALTTDRAYTCFAGGVRSCR